MKIVTGKEANRQSAAPSLAESCSSKPPLSAASTGPKIHPLISTLTPSFPQQRVRRHFYPIIWLCWHIYCHKVWTRQVPYQSGYHHYHQGFSPKKDKIKYIVDAAFLIFIFTIQHPINQEKRAQLNCNISSSRESWPTEIARSHTHRKTKTTITQYTH